MLEDRTLEVSWNSNVNKRYLTSLLVTTNNNKNTMAELIQTISLSNISIDGVKTLSQTEKTIYEVNCYVNGLEQLNKLILSLEKLNYIEKVERVFR